MIKYIHKGKHQIRSLVTCYNYSDYLRPALHFNHSIIDHIYVITHPSDKYTINLCGQYGNVTCLQTNLFHLNGEKFYKSAAINYGLDYIGKFKGWMIISDADTILDRHLRQEVQKLDLKSDILYGCQRTMITRDYQAIPIRPAEGYKFSAGYFQMYRGELGSKRYDLKHTGLRRCDKRFIFNFKKNIMLDNLQCYHVGNTNVDHFGRTSAIWNSIDYELISQLMAD